MTARRDVILKDVRLSFPQLWEPRAFREDQKPRYEASFILDVDDPQIEGIEAAIEEVKEEQWPKGAPRRLEVCLKDGEEKDYDGYGPGVMFVSSASYNKPAVVDRRKRDLTERDGIPYGGCFVNCHITIWAQDNQFGKRVNAGLVAVQFLRDGPAFGAGPASASKLEDLGEDPDEGITDPEDDDFLD